MSDPQEIPIPASPPAPDESPRPPPLDVGPDDAEDPFAQIGSADESEAAHDEYAADLNAPQEDAAPAGINAIFGDDTTDADDGDVFAQLGGGEEPEDGQPLQDEPAMVVDDVRDDAAEAPAAALEAAPQPEVKVTVDGLFGEENGADLFEQLAGGDEAFDLGAAEPSAHTPVQQELGAEQPQASAQLVEADFSDLLAEFGDDLAVEPAPAPAPAPASAPTGQGTSAPPAPVALFDDADGSSAFDSFMQQPDSSSSPPHVRSEQPAQTPIGIGINLDQGDVSLASNGSDWLADTTMATDDGGDGNQPITFEVPQGWYDDAGNWHWYTAEEKEQVRQAMLAESTWQQPGPDSKPELATPLYSPGLGTSQSENAARRTPQPESASQLSSASSYDPYAPSQPTTATSYGTSSSAYSSSPYAPAAPAQPSPYAPQPAAYDPYAPSSSSGPKIPHGLPAEPYAYNTKSAPSTLRAAPSRPAEPKRVISNAYDPPFLRPQKSVVRPASAAPAPFTGPASHPYGSVAVPSPGGQPALPAYPTMAQSVLSPATPAKPAPPPSGPRRAKTPSAPSFAPPPEPAPAVPPPQRDAYAPGPSQDPYAPSAAISSPPPQPTASMPAPAAPPAAHPPVRNASYNAFDPPLRPTSAARARPVAAAAPPARSSTPPIASLAPPPQTAPSRPPRGPSRGSMRKPSPMFESRPQLPTFPSEHRPPSRGDSTRGVSPLVAPAEIPSRPASRAAESYISPPSPPSQPDLEEHDPEGGPVRDQPSWSPQQPPQAPPRPPSISHEPSRGSHDIAREHYSARQVSPRTEPDDHSPDLSSGQPGRRDSYPKPVSHIPTSSYDPYQPSSYQPSGYEPSRNDSYGLGLNTSGSPNSHSRPIDSPYGPQATPSSQSARPIASPSAPTQQLGSHSRGNSYDPYAPGTGQASAYAPSSSTGAYQPSSIPQPPSSYDPYAPQSSLLTPGDNQPRPAAPSSYGSDFGISPPQPSYFQAMTASQDTTYVPQQVLEQKPIAEDPLGRSTLAARNAPLAVFGFGGVLVTGFPGRAESDTTLGHHRTPSYGYASGRGQLWIRTVSDLASTSALKPNDNVFPGPLVLDPSTHKGAAGEKKKKESVIAYLQARAEEIERGLPYLKSSASQAKREEEGKLVLVRILLAMVIGDGKLSGRPEVEDALRTALGNASSINGPGAMSFASPINPSSMNQIQAGSARADPARLKDLSDFLSRGEKREAAQYAARRGLWAHALVISSSVDPDLWAEMVSRFAEAELQANPDLAALTASYAVFSGKTASSVDDLVHAASLAADSSNDQWREVIASVVFNGKPADLACLDELGARFRKAGLNYPSHACHILAPSSPFADISPGAFDRTISLCKDLRDEDAIIFAEIAEYARSLVALPKGQDLAFPGLPQLLPYKLQRAWLAAELGDVEQAKRYCTAVETASKPGKNQPQILSPALLSSLEDLTERLTGTPSANPARLIGGRKTKAGLGSWIEGRLTKFIAGEEDASTPAKPIPAAAKDSGAPIGPFSHFSTISPAASVGVSRNVSTGDFAGNGYGHDSSSSSTYEADYSAQPAAPAAYSSWSSGQDADQAAEDDDTPTGNDGEAEFINPMAALSLGARGTAPSDYQPPASSSNNRYEEEDDDEDMGFGNSSLSRGRTPRPAAGESVADKGKKKDDSPAPAEEKKPDAAAEKPKAKGWLGGWFGKKDGESSGGVVRAKLGEESQMVYDKELKRWVMKGAKPEPLPSAPPPPPRAQTASPSQVSRPDASGGPRPLTAAPPPPTLGRGSAPPPGMPRSSTAPTGLGEGPDGGFRRAKSSLADSITADELSSSTPPGSTGPPPPPGPPGGGPPKPPSRPGTASIDDLLSRPPSKRPGSAAKKPMRNRYVDVLTPSGGGQ